MIFFLSGRSQSQHTHVAWVISKTSPGLHRNLESNYVQEKPPLSEQWCYLWLCGDDNITATDKGCVFCWQSLSITNTQSRWGPATLTFQKDQKNRRKGKENQQRSFAPGRHLRQDDLYVTAGKSRILLLFYLHLILESCPFLSPLADAHAKRGQDEFINHQSINFSLSPMGMHRGDRSERPQRRA